MIARKWGALLPTIFVLAACDKSIDPVAGTNNETHSKGTLYQANGKVAAGARVRVFAANQDAADSLPVTQTQVDANGQIPLQLKRGYYSLLADDTSHRAVFIDSVFSDGDTVMIPTDTLRPTGSITGHVGVQPMHSPAIAWVHLMRTNLYANVDSSGAFRLSGVPAGSLDLVAVTHLPEYTPTHKLVRTRPDSMVDVDTITLVYNGLPLATGIAATYDSLTGVVTVTWHDTSFSRKDDWVVYRSEGSGQIIDSIAASPVGLFADTVFAAFGHRGVHSNQDSLETSFTYWVSARSKDGSKGHRWSRSTVETKSPALAKRWNVAWSGVRSLPFSSEYDQVRLDTLKTGIATIQISSWNSTNIVFRLSVLDTLGTWTVDTITSSTDVMQSWPIFWKGKLWMIHGGASTKSFPDSIWSYEDQVMKFIPQPRRIFDSVRILSSDDGRNWDSTSISTPFDSLTAFRLVATSGSLHLAACYSRFIVPMSMDASRVVASWSSQTGAFWQQEPTSVATSGSDGPSFPLDNRWPFDIHSIGGEDWTVNMSKELGGYWLIPGVSDLASEAIFYSPGQIQVAGANDLLAYGDKSRFGLANPSSAGSWQLLKLPEPSIAATFWRNQLVTLGAKGLHFATITPNR